MNNAEQKRLMRQTMKARLRKYKSRLRTDIAEYVRIASEEAAKVDALYRDLEIRDALLDQRRSDLAAYQETIRKIAEVLASTGYSTDRGFLWDDVRRMAADAKRYCHIRNPDIGWPFAFCDLRDPMNKGKDLPYECIGDKLDSLIDSEIARSKG